LFGNIGDVVKVTEELLEELEANKMAIGEDHMITFNAYLNCLFRKNI